MSSTVYRSMSVIVRRVDGHLTAEGEIGAFDLDPIAEDVWLSLDPAGCSIDLLIQRFPNTPIDAVLATLAEAQLVEIHG